MRLTFRDRINYHRSFTMRERYRRIRERLARKIAYALPAEVRKWVIVHRHAELTTGEFSGRHPDEVTAFELHKGLD